MNIISYTIKPDLCGISGLQKLTKEKHTGVIPLPCIQKGPSVCCQNGVPEELVKLRLPSHSPCPDPLPTVCQLADPHPWKPSVPPSGAHSGAGFLPQWNPESNGSQSSVWLNPCTVKILSSVSNHRLCTPSGDPTSNIPFKAKDWGRGILAIVIYNLQQFLM